MRSWFAAHLIFDICFFEANYKLKKTKLAYNSLNNNYEDILSEAEIKKDKLMEDTENNKKRYRMVVVHLGSFN